MNVMLILKFVTVDSFQFKASGHVKVLYVMTGTLNSILLSAGSQYKSFSVGVT